MTIDIEKPLEIMPNIQDLIYVVRGKQVMVDCDLAVLYKVETKKLNQAVKRNIARFPDNFMFKLTDEELVNLRSQFVTSSFLFLFQSIENKIFLESVLYFF